MWSPSAWDPDGGQSHFLVPRNSKADARKMWPCRQQVSGLVYFLLEVNSEEGVTATALCGGHASSLSGFPSIVPIAGEFLFFRLYPADPSFETLALKSLSPDVCSTLSSGL